MNKEELTNAIASKTALSKKDSQKILDALIEAIMETVAENNKITLVGFGSFELRERKERQGINPKTREPISIPATQVPAFAAGKLFKEKVTPPPVEKNSKSSSKAKSKAKAK